MMAMHPVAAKLAECEAAIQACRREATVAAAYAASASAMVVRLGVAVAQLERESRRQRRLIRYFAHSAIVTCMTGLALVAVLKFLG